ncbi:MAG: tRNA (5-methylaminomethyl-2-thiouridine)(34)-methyltransferase MnmD [Chitinophagales bacterium]|nr:tRNA (5-methylaminomethyl-2-thiouridine)(34)-methyltransferase MnmD [Chitinophagales bacterium]
MKTGEIFETQDGSHSIHSEKFGVSYHSKYGAIQESRHVFLEAGLYAQLEDKEEVAVLEIGFGTGLNALLTYQEAEEKKLRIRYDTFEAYPITLAEAITLNYPSLLGKGVMEEVFNEMHKAAWSTPIRLGDYFTFTKYNELFQRIDYPETFNVIYFDAFAPNAQPELWETELMEKMYNALKPGGMLVTYCAKGAVKRVMKGLGFTVEALKGPPGKREMTRAVKPNEV